MPPQVELQINDYLLINELINFIDLDELNFVKSVEGYPTEDVQALRDSSTDQTNNDQATLDDIGTKAKRLFSFLAQNNLINAETHTPVFLASKHNYPSLLKFLIAEPNIDINQANDLGYTPLIIAAMMGNDLVVETLLTHQNIQINKANDFDNTALIMAAENGHLKIVSALLAVPETQVNNRNVFGQTAISLAISNANSGIQIALISRPELQMNPFQIMVVFNDFNELAFIRQTHGYPDETVAKMRNGIENVDSFRELTSFMCNPSLQNETGNTPLILAICSRIYVVALYLLANKETDINHENHQKQNALVFATHFGRETVVKSLLAHPRMKEANLDQLKLISGYALEKQHIAIAAYITSYIIKNTTSNSGAATEATMTTHYRTPPNAGSAPPPTPGSKRKHDESRPE